MFHQLITEGKFEVDNINPNLCTHIVYAYLSSNSDGNITVFGILEENYGRGFYSILIYIRFGNQLFNHQKTSKSLSH